MKKLVKILPILMTVLMVFMAISPVFAFPPASVAIDKNVDPNVTNTGAKILGIIQVVGTIAAVGILMVVGIKYMMGSAEQKAEYKKVMIPYIIGAVILFAAAQLLNVIYNFADTFKN